MPLWITGEILFYTGTVLISFAAIGAVISAIILHISNNRLNCPPLIKCRITSASSTILVFTPIYADFMEQFEIMTLRYFFLIKQFAGFCSEISYDKIFVTRLIKRGVVSIFTGRTYHRK